VRFEPATPSCSIRVRATPWSTFPGEQVEEAILEEIPDVTYEDIGGLAKEIEDIRDAVELPFLYAELFEEHKLKPPKGILLYGPPGCGKSAHRQGGGELAGPAGRGEDGADRRALLLPQHQGPGTAEQVRR